jgi:hypothetical protein
MLNPSSQTSAIINLTSPSPATRNVLAAIAATGALGLALAATPSDAQTAPATDASVIGNHPANLRAAAEDKTIRPYRIKAPEKELADLRRRIAATRWPVTHWWPRYWLTNAAVSSVCLYWESKLAFAPKGVQAPAAVSVFPDEIYAAPRSWTESLSQTDLLQPTPERRPLRRVGASRDSSLKISGRHSGH